MNESNGKTPPIFLFQRFPNVVEARKEIKVCICTKNPNQFHHIFTNIVGNISLLKLSKSLILSKPHYWRKHILIKILTAPNTSSQYLHPINIKEMHFSALLNRDSLVILGHFCHESAPEDSPDSFSPAAEPFRDTSRDISSDVWSLRKLLLMKQKN